MTSSDGLNNQAGRKLGVDIDGPLEVGDLDMFVRRVRHRDGSRTDEQRFAPSIEEWDVGGEREHRRIESGHLAQPNGRNVEDILEREDRLRKKGR